MTNLTPDEIEALLLSLKVSSVAVAVALPFAVATALVLSRSFWGKSLLDGIVQLPLVLPPVAMGFILLTIFGTRSGAGAFLKDQFGIVLVFRWTGAVLASAIFTFPFQVRAIRQALEARDKGLDQAARTLGAGWLDRLINITLLRWANLAPSSRSFRTFPAKPALCRLPSTPRCRRRAAKRKRRVCPCSPSCWPSCSF